MERIKILPRTLSDFPVDVNIPCTLSGVSETGHSFPKSCRYIEINHLTKVPNFIIGKPPLKNAIFTDKYYIEDLGKGDSWQLRHLLAVLGCRELVSTNDTDDFIQDVKKVISGLSGAEYFLKTRMALTPPNNRCYLKRGSHPYVSKTPNLSYLPKENEYNYFKIIKNIL
jgi:hypothetical protein